VHIGQIIGPATAGFAGPVVWSLSIELMITTCKNNKSRNDSERSMIVTNCMHYIAIRPYVDCAHCTAVLLNSEVKLNRVGIFILQRSTSHCMQA